jgi:hypothetical protein
LEDNSVGVCVRAAVLLLNYRFGASRRSVFPIDELVADIFVCWENKDAAGWSINQATFIICSASTFLLFIYTLVVVPPPLRLAQPARIFLNYSLVL